jgi:hypothetical protein
VRLGDQRDASPKRHGHGPAVSIVSFDADRFTQAENVTPGKGEPSRGAAALAWARGAHEKREGLCVVVLPRVHAGAFAFGCAVQRALDRANHGHARGWLCDRRKLGRVDLPSPRPTLATSDGRGGGRTHARAAGRRCEFAGDLARFAVG